MKLRRRLVVFPVLLLVMGLLLSTPVLAQSRDVANPKIPGMIGITTLRIGSAAHAMATALGEVLKEQTGAKIRVIPIGAEKPRVNLLRSGDVHFAILPGSAMYYLQLGLEDYAAYEWGPQPLQMAWLGPAYLGMLTTKAHKDINTVADIKGKRVAVLPHKSTVLLTQSFLAFAGLKWKDVVKVSVPGYTAQFKALMAGTVDVAPIANPMSAILYELEASPRGLKWLPFPHKDKEGWKRLRKISPWGVPAKVTIGPGLSKKKPLESFMIAYAFVVYETQDPDLVYLMTKTIAENLERLKTMAGAWKVYTLDLAIGVEGFPHSYHRGAIRYFKEKGLWTSKHENWNRKQIELQRRLKDAWGSTLDQALKEKWKPEKLRKQWHEVQKKITGYEVPVVE